MKNITLLIACLIFIGCASTPYTTYNYIQPNPNNYEIINEIRTDKPFEEVWTKIVKNLNKSPFVISNIEKESRIINVSFSTDNPQEYVNCGKTFRSFTRGNITEFYRYELASHSTYKDGKTWGNFNSPLIHTINRQPSLNGKANIYLASTDKGTIVKINIKYSMKFNADGYSEYENLFGGLVKRNRTYYIPSVCTFSTSTTGTFYQNSNNITCMSKGTLEDSLLKLIE